MPSALKKLVRCTAFVSFDIGTKFVFMDLIDL